MSDDSTEVVSENRLSPGEIADRIRDPKIAQALADLLYFYYYDAHDLNSFASAENEGKRLEGLLNEIYSCFHHVARGLCEPENDSRQQLSEIKRAEQTHLHRLVLDAYKVIIASFLEEYTHVVETLKYFILIEYLEAFQRESVETARNILEMATAVKKEFMAAKKAEKHGDFNRTVELFNSTIEKCYLLREGIQKFNKSDLYCLALSKREKEQQDKKSEKKKDRYWQIACIIIAALFGAFASTFFDIAKDKIFTEQSSTEEKVSDNKIFASEEAIPDAKQRGIKPPKE